MRWPLTIVVMSLVLAVSLGLYRLESEVQTLERRLAKATTQLEDNRHNSSILAAEWSFLTRPSRIQALARRHLKLQDLTPGQISQFAALPSKKLDEVDGAGNASAERREGQPPLPGWKRAKRIILAEHGRAAR